MGALAVTVNEFEEPDLVEVAPVKVMVWPVAVCVKIILFIVTTPLVTVALVGVAPVSATPNVIVRFSFVDVTVLPRLSRAVTVIVKGVPVLTVPAIGETP